MSTWVLPVSENGVAADISFDLPSGSTIEVPPGGRPLRIWDAPERCDGWRWPALMAVVEPVPARVQFWSPHTGEASAVTVRSLVDGMPLWGPNGRGVLTFAKRAGFASDEQAAKIAAAWLRIPIPARRASMGALRKTIAAAARDGAAVAARALAITAFDTQEHRLGRRVAEPTRAAIRAAAACIVVRDLVKNARSGLTQSGFDLLTSPWTQEAEGRQERG